MRQAVVRLEKLGVETRRRFERDHGDKSWFQDWYAMPESVPLAAGDDEEGSLWTDSETPESESPAMAALG